MGSPPMKIELVVGLCPVSTITQEPNENLIAFLENLKEALQNLPVWTLQTDTTATAAEPCCLFR